MNRRHIFGLMAALSLVVILGSPKSAHAYTAAQLATLVPNAQATIVGYESGCTNRLNAQLPSKSRGAVNASNPYVGETYISPQGTPSATSVTVPYGTTSVPLQINQFTFLCSILVNNSEPAEIRPAYTWDTGAEVTNGNYPNERAPVAGDGASLYVDNTLIDSATVVTGAGSIGSSPAGGTYQLGRDNTTRYWFSGNTPAFTYIDPAGLTTSQTVVVQITITSISGYHPASGRVYQCISKATGRVITVPNDTDFGVCASSTADLPITINVTGYYKNTLTLTPPTQTVNAGSVATLYMNVQNTGTAPSPNYTVNDNYSSPAGGAGYFGDGGSSGGTWTGATDSDTWANQTGLAAGASAPPFVINLTTSSSTPTNTYCFTATITPYTNNAPPTPNSFTTPQACILVLNPKIPLLNVAAGDVHAGCPTNGNGSATITTNAGSSTAEVVSAAGTISGLSSAINSVNESLNNYTTIEPLCLPNLATEAASFENPTSATVIAAGSNVDLATLTTANGIYWSPGSIIIHGVASKDITLIVQGTVTVNGSVTLNPAAEPRNLLPGLGVIALGGISFVPSGAQRDEADGYFWTGGTISTCAAAPGSCNNTLQVNGALMGNKVLLQRYGAAGAFGDVVAENIAISGQLYLNPPPLFGVLNPTSDANADGRGEQTPRY